MQERTAYALVGQEWILPVLAAALALLVLLLLVVLVRERSRNTRELRAAHAEATSLRAQVEEIERRLTTPAPEQRSRTEAHYLITHLGEHDGSQVEGSPPGPGGAHDRVDGALFADLVLRETVVKAAALTHGLRRALRAETRHRIRFEVRRQTRSARKQRRRELRDLARQARGGDSAPDAA